MVVKSVPIRTNPDLRPSRLVSSIPGYVGRSVTTIVKIFMLYRPMRFFLTIGLVPMCAGIVLGIRWFLLAYGQPVTSHLPSLVLTGVLILVGLQIWTVGLISNLMAANRKLAEGNRILFRRIELAQRNDDPD